MKILSLVIFTIIVSASAFCQKIGYVLSMPEPHTHYFNVELKLSNLKQDQIQVKMPVWAPGSYLVREFAKHVEEFTASSKGKSVGFALENKNTWTIETKGLKEVIVKYKVYAFELTVRTSFLDADHGFISGTSIFMYVAGKKNLPITLEINPYDKWKTVSTSLEATNAKSFKYKAPDYDILVDSPIEIGNHLVFNFDAGGVNHEVAMYGEGNFDVDKLKVDMAKVVESCTAVFGENPNKNYTFIIHNTASGGGGLEHLSSTTLGVSRWGYQPERKYNGFLSLVAHEYFHLWNVKRIRPVALGPFDYDSENYTRHLWVSEGFTSYYDELLMRRCGYYDADRYLRGLAGTISRVENQPGNSVQPVSEASYHAWIKAYRSNENSYNTTISYYPKGAMIALVLDLQIIEATKGAKNLDDLLKALWNNYYKKDGSGFTEEDLKKELKNLLGVDITYFFTRHINGIETLAYNTYLSAVGCKLENNETEDMNFGVNASWKSGKLIVKRVTRGTAGYQGGVNVNDEIISVDGYRVGKNKFKDLINNKEIGSNVEILISRDGIVRTLKMPVFKAKRLKYTIGRVENPTPEQETNYKKWLSL